MKKLLFVFLLFALLLFSRELYSQWVSIKSFPDSLVKTSIVSNGTKLFVGTYRSPWGFGGVYMSTNEGANWYKCQTISSNFYCLLSHGIKIFAGAHGANNGVHYSTDGGISWTMVLQGKNIGGFFAKDSNTIFVGSDSGVYYSNNSGLSYTNIGLRNSFTLSFTYLNNYLYTAKIDGNSPLAKTSNNGTNWTEIYPGYMISSLLTVGSNIFAGSANNGVMLSSDNGITWNSTGPSLGTVAALMYYNNTLFAGTINGMYVSTNLGVNWVQKNEGFTHNVSINGFAILNNYLYVSSSDTIWKRPLSQITSTQSIYTEIPTEYSLSQNYPNPFNPATKILYQIPKTSDVKITVYDIKGTQVRTLVNVRMNAGSYEVTFYGNGLSSGVYLYVMKTGEFITTKRMILLK